MWREILPRLAGRYRVHTVDLPGYGGSSAVEARSFDEAVGLLEACVPGDAIVCGWSLGAQLALGLARSAPDRVRALALVSATPCFLARPGWTCAMDTGTFDAFAADLAADADATVARFVRLAALNGTRSREAIRALAGMLREGRSAERASLRATLAWMQELDLRAQAPLLRVPTVAIHGEADAVTPIGAGRWLADHIPGARFAAIPACAHAPFITHPAEFLSAVEAVDG